jgi:hypothetical protein
VPLLINPTERPGINNVRAAFNTRNIVNETLMHKNAKWKNVAMYAKYGNLKYIYFLGHGDYGYQLFPGGANILRTLTHLFDGPCYSFKASDFVNPPAWCTPFPRKSVEKKAKTWASMNWEGLRLFYNEGCYTGRLKFTALDQLIEGQPGNLGANYDGPTSDMLWALNMNDFEYNSQIYFGWFNPAQVGWFDPLQPGGVVYSSYQNWTDEMFNLMGEGQTFMDGLTAAVLSGLPLQNDPASAYNNWRIKGHGSLNLRLTNLDND